MKSTKNVKKASKQLTSTAAKTAQELSVDLLRAVAGGSTNNKEECKK